MFFFLLTFFLCLRAVWEIERGFGPFFFLPFSCSCPLARFTGAVTFSPLEPHRKPLPADSSDSVEILHRRGAGLQKCLSQRCSTSLRLLVSELGAPLSGLEFFLDSASLYRNCHFCSGNKKYTPEQRVEILTGRRKGEESTLLTHKSGCTWVHLQPAFPSSLLC